MPKHIDITSVPLELQECEKSVNFNDGSSALQIIIDVVSTCINIIQTTRGGLAD